MVQTIDFFVIEGNGLYHKKVKTAAKGLAMHLWGVRKHIVSLVLR